MNKTNTLTTFLLLFCLFSCKQKPDVNDPLPSWRETPVKQSILNYLNKSITAIPDSDRIAVFDMDGTIVCEKPLWFEMYMAVKGLNEKSAINPKLLKYEEYQYAQKLGINPFDTTVTNHWGTYVDSMVWKAYVGYDNEVYVDSSEKYLTKTKSPDPRFGKKPDMKLADLFYQPMLELIQLLKNKNFSVYVVSGSMQGVIWSICPKIIGFDRAHLIGSTQILKPVYQSTDHETKFILQKGIFTPKDNGDGKSLNIYSHIGKVPVFAFGNTTGDFGMFHLASTSKYPNVEYLLNHDDAIREYAYQPYYDNADSTWQKTMKDNGWTQVNMSTAFKTVWMKRK